MGVSASWMIVTGMSGEQLLDKLGFVETGRKQARRPSAQAGLAVMPSGWLVFINDRGGSDEDREWARRLSESGDVLLVEEVDVVSFSAFFRFREGEQVCSIIHDPEGDIPTVVADGWLPECFARHLEAADRAEELDPDCDHHIEVPLAVAAEISGFAMDRPEAEWEVYAIVEPIAVAQKRAAKAERQAQRRASGGWLGTLTRLLGGK